MKPIINSLKIICITFVLNAMSLSYAIKLANKIRCELSWCELSDFHGIKFFKVGGTCNLQEGEKFFLLHSSVIPPEGIGSLENRSVFLGVDDFGN